jgi:hypothetical protein
VVLVKGEDNADPAMMPDQHSAGSTNRHADGGDPQRPRARLAPALLEVVQLPAYLAAVIGIEPFDARIALADEGLLGPGLSSTLDFPHG